MYRYRDDMLSSLRLQVIKIYYNRYLCGLATIIGDENEDFSNSEFRPKKNENEITDLGCLKNGKR